VLEWTGLVVGPGDTLDIMIHHVSGAAQAEKLKMFLVVSKCKFIERSIVHNKDSSTKSIPHSRQYILAF
jgi:hypothetical protein